MNPLLAVGLALAAIAVIYYIAMRMDRERINEYLGYQGSEVLSITWEPFGRGWFGEKDSRIYLVRYKMQDGTVKEAYCKTSLFSGVYFSEETVLHRPSPSPRDESAREAIRRYLGTATPDTEPAAPPRNPSDETEIGALQAEIRRLRADNLRLADELDRLRKQ